MLTPASPQAELSLTLRTEPSKCNIVFVAPRFHPCPGGYENYVAWLAKSLRQSGANVSVFTTNAIDLEAFWIPGRRTLPPGEEDWEGIHIHRFAICYRRWLRRAGRVLSLLPNWQLRARFGRPGFRVIGITGQLRRAPADVIHVGPLPYNQLMYHGIHEARRRRIRVIATPCTHFGEDANRDVAMHYTGPSQVELLNHCDAVLALTNVERERLIELGVSPEKVAVTGIGIDADEVTGGDARACRQALSLDDAPVVLHLGMKAFDKGSNSVVEAMKILWARGCRARLVMAGPSLQAFDDFLAPQTAHLDRLVNLPPVSEREKRNLLAAASVVVQPSRVESFGLISVEAWANAKPIIVADTAVSRELIEDGVDGLIVPFGDGRTLAGAIDRLLQSDDQRQQMGEGGRQKALARFCWDAAAARIRPYFENRAVPQRGPV